MLKRDNGRGVHPKLRASSHRFWPMDDTVRGSVVDLSPLGVDLGDVGVGSLVEPQIVDGMIGGKAQRFEDSAEITDEHAAGTVENDNTLSSAGDATSRTVFEGEFTFAAWFRDRRSASATTEGDVFSYMGDVNLDTAATNFMFSLRTQRGGADEPLYFDLFWENGAGADVVIGTFDAYAIPKNEWIYVAIRKRATVAGAGPTGKVIVDLFVNGQLVQTRYALGTITSGLAGTWTWDGTTTVLSTNTSGVAVQDYVRKDSDSPWFRITAITANVDVTIDNVDSLTIPSGTGADRRAPIENTSDGADAVYIFGGHYEGAAVAATNFGTFDCCGAYLWSEVLDAEEIEDDHRRGLLLPFYHRIDATVAVEGPPPASAMIDLSSHEGLDWIESITITDGVDAATRDATINLVREQENLSLAALKTDTPLNLETLNDLTSFDPLLEITRDVVVKTARVPLGISATDRDWITAFRGTIDEVEWGNDAVSLSCRDQGGILIDTYIEEEREFGAGATATLEATLQQVADDNDGPTAPTNTDSYDAVTVFAPKPSQWVMNLRDGEPEQQLKTRREPVMTTLRALAGQIGFDCRYRYDNDPDSIDAPWRLTLYEPERLRLDQDFNLRSGEVLSVARAGINAQNIRNVVRVAYPSSEAVDPTVTTAAPAPLIETNEGSGTDGNGNRVSAYYEVESPTSTGRFKRRFMEVQEASGSQIDTVDEAQRMAVAMLRDLEEPELEHNVSVIPMPELCVGDMIKFDRNEQLYTGQQRLAVKSVTHTLDADGAGTSVQLRGKPSVGFRRWLSTETRPGVGGGPPVISPLESLTDVQRGSLLQFVTGLIDRTDYLTGGKYLAIKNANLSQYTRGLGNYPDSWTNVGAGGTWGTDLLASTDALSGAYSLEATDASFELASDFFPVDGDVNKPLSFEATTKKTNASGDYLQLQVYWYTAARVLVSSDDLTSDLYTGVPSDTDWHTLRADGVYVPGTTTKYGRIVLKSVPGNGSAFRVDSVAAYVTSNACLTDVDSRGVVKTNGTKTNVTWEDASPTYDRGNQLGEDLTAAGDGHHFLVRKSGTYDFKVRIWLLQQSSSTQTGTLDMWLAKNATYTSDVYDAASGTTIDFVRDDSYPIVGAVGQKPIELAGSVELVEGDTVSSYWEFTGANSHSASNGPTGASARFELRLRNLD